MASICAVGNPLLSPQDASSLSFLSFTRSVHPIMCSLRGPIYQALSFLFVLAVPILLQLLPLSYSCICFYLLYCSNNLCVKSQTESRIVIYFDNILQNICRSLHAKLNHHLKRCLKWSGFGTLYLIAPSYDEYFGFFIKTHTESSWKLMLRIGIHLSHSPFSFHFFCSPSNKDLKIKNSLQNSSFELKGFVNYSKMWQIIDGKFVISSKCQIQQFPAFLMWKSRRCF